MNRIQLLQSEKRTLWGLVTFPLANDRELSEFLGQNQSTTTKIKNRLLNNEFIFDARIPDLERLGCELFVASYGRFITTISTKDSIDAMMELPKQIDDMFYVIDESDQGLALGASKNYTAVKRNMDLFERIYNQDDVFIGEPLSNVIFPFELVKITRWFEYSPLLSYLFDINIREFDIPIEWYSQDHLSRSLLQPHLEQQIMAGGLTAQYKDHP